MKHVLSFLALAAVVSLSSGCSIVDRLFLLNTDGPYGHHVGGACQDGACQDGACQDGACQGGGCQDGACQDGACLDGACHGSARHGRACPEGICAGGKCSKCPDGTCGRCAHCRHLGRYGGLARHHLSAAEKQELMQSGYENGGPAGPPTGAVAYPYYTTRGPRDFLAKRPPSIGP